MRWLDRIKRKSWYIRLFNWEYWPTLAFYWPMLAAYPWLALRSRHLCFFTAANPGIYTGGLGMESKYQTLMKLPEAFRPKTILTRADEAMSSRRQRLQAAGIGYPLVAKPDIGFRGLLVKVIHSEAELEAFLERYPVDFLLQEFLDYPSEVGVLYYRLPGEARGTITSVTLKEFLFVRGDGRSTVRQLVEANPRALLQYQHIRRQYAELLDTVPFAGERIRLGHIGNHAKGTRFINGNERIDQQLTRTFDRLSHKMQGINYGRFDIKCHSLEDLRQGAGFRIIELNGIGSEPTHIYDPQEITYWGALGVILQHWRLICRIGTMNRRAGATCLAPGTMVREILGLRAYTRRLKAITGRTDH